MAQTPVGKPPMVMPTQQTRKENIRAETSGKAPPGNACEAHRDGIITGRSQGRKTLENARVLEVKLFRNQPISMQP